MKFLKKIDGVNLLLLGLLFLMSMLFFYLFTLNKTIENYSKNIDKLNQLSLQNNIIGSYTDHFDQLDNYDILEKSISDFKSIYEKLNTNLINIYPKQKTLYIQLQEINNKFKQEIEDVEYFKSLNSSLISGSHFLFDLQKTISDDPKITADVKNKINETLFYLLRYMSSDYIAKEFLLKKLDILSKEKNKYIQTFTNHTRIIIESIAQLKAVSEDIRANTLPFSINQTRTLLEQLHDESLTSLKVIVLIFFIFLLITTIAFFVSHYRFRQVLRKTQALNYAMQYSDNSIVITDNEKNITYVNDAFVRTSGYSKEEILGQNPRVLKSNLMDQSLYDELNARISNGEKWDGEFINKRKDGSLLYEKASIVPVYVDDQLTSYLAIKLDITKYIEQNLKLKEAASVFENTEEAIVITDKNAKILSVNQAFENIYGYTLEEIKGGSLQFLHSDKHDKQFFKTIWSEIRLHDKWQGKIINKCKDGTFIPVWETIKVNKDELGNVISYIAVQTDLREVERHQEKIDYLAYHDPLTGLNNRTSLEEYLINTLALAKRNEHMLAVLFIDLDKFKIINDTLGHEQGDQLLRIVTSRLKKVLRESDYIVRWAGDEFIVILENIKSVEHAGFVAKNIIKTLQQPYKLDDREASVTASIGISIFPDNGADADTLIKNADSAMYYAKDKGKNNFQFYTRKLSKIVDRKLAIDVALSRALQMNEFFMLFQPQYDLQTKQITSVEALIRWQNEKLGFVGPDEFIPIAEDNGQIIRMGYFIFEESCKAYVELKKHHPTIKQIAINVSSIQFHQPQLLKKFLFIAERYEIAPQEIELELTERFVMSSTHENIAVLQSFRNVGFKISIDDFGTGYSSMAYLKSLPIDTLKIDKSFVDDIGDDAASDAIVKTIIDLAHNLDFELVAEGIETKEQEDFLRNIGCQTGQGYFFAKPMDVATIIERFA